jgi:hypothetical protein
MIKKPFPESYWVIPGIFLAGGYPIPALGDNFLTRQVLKAFLEAGFDTFFDLTRARELPPYLSILLEEAAVDNISIDYRRFSIQDLNLPTRPQMVELLNAIDATLAAGHRIYLHCWGGIGRTGVTVGCWLVRHGLNGDEALLRLNELYRTARQSSLYPHSPETDAQVEFIHNWTENGLA